MQAPRRGPWAFSGFFGYGPRRFEEAAGTARLTVAFPACDRIPGIAQTMAAPVAPQNRLGRAEGAPLPHLIPAGGEVLAGHSKWANIKHRKARQDSKRSKIWSKCSRAIIVAAKHGGGDPDQNLTLRYAIDEAKAANMPKDTIAKAIEKGAGGSDGDNYEEVVYEGYGPAGVAVYIETLTDNKNRTVPELRKMFEKCGGNLASAGSVAFTFERKGELFVDRERVEEERLMEVVIEAGAEDVEDADGAWRITTAVEDFQAVRAALEAADLAPDAAGLPMLPLNVVELDDEQAEKTERFLDDLDDHDDVQKVYANGQRANAEAAE